MIPDSLSYKGSNFNVSFSTILQNQAKALSTGTGTFHIPRASIKNRKLTDGMLVHTEPEIFIQTHGSTRFTMPDQTFIVKSGDVCLIPRHVPHTEESIRDDNGEFCNLVIRPLESNGVILHLGIAGKCKSPVVGCEQKYYPFTESTWGPDFLDSLLANAYKTAETDLIILRSGITIFLRWLMKLVQNEYSSDENKTTPLIERCQHYIQHELHNQNLSVPIIAKACNCSPNHLSATYHHHCGIKLIDYINSLRIIKAEQLLGKTSLQISKISYACGFRDPAYFSRLFKTKTGSSPKRYRTIHSSN